MEMFSTPPGIKLADQKNVTLLDGYLVIEVKGDGKPFEGYARALAVRNRVGKTEEPSVDGIFIEKGLVPNSKCLAGLVQTDPAAGSRWTRTTVQA